jgi:hypothetical protein
MGNEVQRRIAKYAEALNRGLSGMAFSPFKGANVREVCLL